MCRRTIAAAAMAVVVGSIPAAAQNAGVTAQQNSPSRREAQNAQTMTVVGCLIRESDYRRAHGLGKGGVAGVRTGSDFVIVNAKTAEGSAAASASADSSTPAAAPARTSAGCAETAGIGEAYRLAGKTEGELKRFVGQYVEITGRFEHGHDAKIAAGDASAKLPAEIVVASYRAAAAPAAEPIATAGQTPSQTPSQTPRPATPSAQPAPSTPPAQAARELPRTASNEPLVALIGLLSLGAAIVVGAARRRIA